MIFSEQKRGLQNQREVGGPRKTDDFTMPSVGVYFTYTTHEERLQV